MITKPHGPGSAILFPSALLVMALSFLLPACLLPAGRGLFWVLGSAAFLLFAVTPLLAEKMGLTLDRIIFSLIIILVGLGLSLLGRLQIMNGNLGSVALRQLAWLPLGLIAMFAGLYVGRSYLTLCHYRYLILSVALAIMALTIPFGTVIGGSRAWLNLGILHVQPSEFARTFLIFYLASYLGQYQPLLRATRGQSLPLWKRRWLLGPVLSMWSLSILVLIFQRDLGAAVLYYAAFLIVLYLASGNAKYVMVGVLLGASGCLTAAALLPYVKTRFLVWLHPLSLSGGPGYQSARSLYALAAGGFFGLGPQGGLPGAIPAVQTDLVFAALGEEFGLLGGLAVLLLFLALVVRGLHLALRCPDRVGYLMIAGLVLTFGVQVLLIVSGTIGLLPLTGVTLPLISYGGSSLVATLFYLGIISGAGNRRRPGLAD